MSNDDKELVSKILSANQKTITTSSSPNYRVGNTDDEDLGNVTEIDEFIDRLIGCDPLARDGICVVHVPYGDPIEAGPGERDAVK